MNASFERHIAIAGAYNIRDLGGYQTGGGTTQWRRILRADGLHRLDAAGVDALHGVGVRTVIDLRHDHELASQPDPFEGDARIAYHNVSLFSDLSPAALLANGGGDMLLGLYRNAIATRHEAIRDVLGLIADAPEEGAVLFHCTAGKDRTGIIAALVLGNAGVDHATIGHDYALTKAAIAPIVADFAANMAARGEDAAKSMPLLACEPETMAALLADLESQFGGIPSYLRHIGLDEGRLGRLRDRLTAVEAAGVA
jgi:protein-tyrosine phosphatase